MWACLRQNCKTHQLSCSDTRKAQPEKVRGWGTRTQTYHCIIPKIFRSLPPVDTPSLQQTHPQNRVRTGSTTESVLHRGEWGTAYMDGETASRTELVLQRVNMTQWTLSMWRPLATELVHTLINLELWNYYSRSAMRGLFAHSPVSKPSRCT